jgi:hypothetical protein
MAAFGKARTRLRLLLSDERGMAVPTALAALVASFGLASAAVLSSVDVQSGSHRDQEAKSAIAAADAGASLALLRLNRFQSSITEATPCVGPAGEPQAASGGWCPAIASEAVGRASFTYQVSAYKKGSELSVVATGSDGVTSRRVDVGLVSVNGKNVFADEHLIGQDGIDISGTAANIETDIGTNGSVTRNGHPVVCGDVRHGPGKPLGWKPDCGKEESEGEKNLPQIAPPSNIATSNSNCRLVPNCTLTKDVDTWVSPPKNKRTSTEPWDAKHSTINVGNGATLTMGGADYYICGLTIKGTVIMAALANVRIFIRKPSECGLASGAMQFEMGAQAVIESTGFSTNHSAPQVYMLGDGSVKLDGGSGTTNHLILYAPESSVELKGNPTWIGMIAGKTIKITGNSTFKTDPNLTAPDITLQGLWQRTHYVECAGDTVSPPNSYC